jgi:hypothetical protein
MNTKLRVCTLPRLYTEYLTNSESVEFEYFYYAFCQGILQTADPSGLAV